MHKTDWNWTPQAKHGQLFSTLFWYWNLIFNNIHSTSKHANKDHRLKNAFFVEKKTWHWFACQNKHFKVLISFGPRVFYLHACHSLIYSSFVFVLFKTHKSHLKIFNSIVVTSNIIPICMTFHVWLIETQYFDMPADHVILSDKDAWRGRTFQTSF